MIVLYVVADRGIFESDAAYFSSLEQLVPVVCEHAGVALQVRAKELAGAARASFIARARDTLGGEAERAFLNGDTDAALAAGFGGVHWPEAAIPAGPAPGLRAGASVHSLAALRRAETAGAAFALFGSVFDAGSKPAAGVGLPALESVARAASIPVLAIGGITPDRAAACIAAGAAGVAAVTGILRARDPAAAVEEYLRVLPGVRPVPVTSSTAH